MPEWSVELELAAQTVEQLSAIDVHFLRANFRDVPADLRPIRLPRPGDPVDDAGAPIPPPKRMSTPQEIAAFLGETGGMFHVTTAAEEP